MTTYIISYDLKGSRDYDKLYKAIKRYGTWAHILESVWAVSSDKSAKQVREHLAQYMDDDDALFVIKSGTAAAWQNVLCRNDWLKEHL